MILQFLLACSFFPLSALAACPAIPPEVPAGQYPAPWVRGDDFYTSNDGTNDYIDCPDGYVGQLGPGTKSFSFGQQYRCDTATGKWIHPGDNYEASEFPIAESTTINRTEPSARSPSIRYSSKYSSLPFTHSLTGQSDERVCEMTRQLRISYQGNEQYCRVGEVLQFKDGPVIKDIKCSGAGLEITDVDGNISYPWSPTVECVSGCPIKNKLSNGTLEDKIISPGGEKYCPAGTTLKFAYGAKIKDIKCSKTGMQISDEYGGVITYTEPDRPILQCFPKCAVRDQLPSGAIQDLILEGGKEQYCSGGQIVGYADGTNINDIKCTSSGLEIEKEDGTIVPYPSTAPPTLKCGPGPTTTTTTVATTTTIPAYCPPEGVWSEWSVTGACASTCGAYNVAARKRTCTDKCGTNCPCLGPSEDVGPCAIALCAFPTICKAPYKKSLNLETNTFFCGEDNVPKIVCPLETTTTSTTVATTTATPKDAPPTAAQLWDVKYYYNFGRILHAFCADQACISVIQSNGIGYDVGSSYSGVVGRAIREDAINAVRAACPTGSASLKNLGFTKVGNHYEHNLSGSGLKQGWVSTTYGACGATVAIKRWKCHFSEDLMYKIDLEENTYYKGLVQDNGQVNVPQPVERTMWRPESEPARINVGRTVHGPGEDVGPCGIALCAFPRHNVQSALQESNTNALFCGEGNILKTKDVAPTAAQLWNVKYYYNAARILHAFCADQACINVIQANGIGYNLNTYSGVVGRAIREDAIYAVRDACFTRIGNHYEHNLSGVSSSLNHRDDYLSFRAVSSKAGCQPHKVLVEQPSESSDGSVTLAKYEVDNAWYKGLVQDNGQIQFYIFCAFINTNPVIAHKNHNSRVFNTMDKFRSNNESVRHPALRGA
ncbi:hypothetical protein PRIPAC_89437, partial [Pristionchus pacificus]|uniref:Uncharacterized protein n=1 Tax=Pristionchus pacificus TaxID=54126 RepID=A0A2A6B6M3_PRIPA